MTTPVLDSLCRFARRALMLGASASFAFAAAQTQEPGDDVTPRGFAIPDTRQARALADRAAEHLAAQRHAEAIGDLQELLVAHRGEVLRASAREDATQKSAYRGAADWAREQLLALPDRGRQLYRDRYEPEASAALDRARRAGDRRELVEVARRYPLCDSGSAAWWTLGDLELELGNREAARDAWTRAAALTAAQHRELANSARERMAFVESAPPPARELAEAVPSADSPSWRRRFEDSAHGTPFNGNPRVADPYAIMPCLAGDTVLICDTMRVFAFDAWSGNPRWTSDEAPGWDAVDAGKVRPNGAPKPLERNKDFFAGLDERSVLAQPAASTGIVVAALQIPISHAYNKDFQNYKITTVIPDRRLFAFDLATGRELWNHMPPPAWDGESGNFAERMRTAAPPVIAGTRVIVPAYRMQGRVDLHVACFDLFTGRLQWSTALISGQLELNMFGRQQREFCAAPACIVGDRVIIATQLGTVAALDLATGDILWETLYDQIAPPANDRWAPEERTQVWNNTAPLCAQTDEGAVVVVTPIDSYEMLGLDLARGTPLWRAHFGKFQRPPRGESRLTLIDVDPQAVLLCGTKVISARAPRGLHDKSGPVEISESNDLSEGRGTPPRAAASAHHVIVPAFTRRIALDRTQLKREDRLASADWTTEQTPGNAVATDGAVFFTNFRFLTACVDFPAVERRYRERMLDDRRDVRAALDYAQLLERRGQSLLAAQKSVREAADLFAKARGALEPHVMVGEQVSDERVAGELFSILYLEANAAADMADRATALERLERARSIAPDEALRARALVRTYSLCDGARDADARERVLVELEHCCANATMPDDWWVATGRESFAPEASDAQHDHPIQVGLWTAVERLRGATQRADVEAELALLHEILARYDDARVPSLDGSRLPPTRASARIQTLLDAGAREAYAPFERAAREMLERARAEHQPEMLERLTRIYPHSGAAREALDARLQAALEAGDAPGVAQIALRRIPDDWFPPRARPEQVEGLLALAAVLEQRGNHELRAALLTSLARHHADLISPLPRDHGATIGALAGSVASAPVERAATTFPPNPVHATSVLGEFKLIATQRFELDGSPEELLVVAKRERNAITVIAYDAATPDLARWQCPIPTEELAGTVRGSCTARSVLIAESERATAIDASKGTVRWTWNAGEEFIEQVSVAGGVAVLALRSSEGRNRLLALDAEGGLELWTAATPRELWSSPVIGSDAVVLLPADYAATPARVLDLFTGARVLDFALPEHVGENDLRGAWIEGRTLVLPAFPKSSGAEARDCVSAWNLDSGKRLWHVPGDEQRAFDSILRRGDETYLIFLGGSDAAHAGFVQELDTRLGAVRRVQNVSIAESDVLIGVQRHEVATLRGPYLLVRSAAPGETEALIRAIHLPYGERWTYRMGVPPNQFYNHGSMPAPELSDSTLALVSTTSSQRKGANVQSTTTLMCFDRDNGLLRASRPLPPGVGGAESIELASLGAGLWLVGEDAMLITY